MDCICAHNHLYIVIEKSFSGGVQVSYSGNKLSSIRTVHLNEGIPELQNVQMDKRYNLVIPSILYKGKSVYGYLKGSFVDLADLEVSKKFYYDVGKCSLVSFYIC
jgi:hypothetical protein